MMKHEFEKMYGHEVSFEDYTNIIEPMYMATNLDKEQFVACLDKKRFALPTQRELMNQIKRGAQHLFDICGHRVDHDAENELEKLAWEYARRFYGLDRKDLDCYVYFKHGYEIPELMRGCTYPREMVIGRKGKFQESFVIVKEG